jgi:ribosomal protein S18 acetylase RimI-like enzyme
VIVREASSADGPALVRLFLETPLVAGTSFVIDRAPDFFASIRPQTRAQTFVAEDTGRLVGVVTGTWRTVSDQGRQVKVGEIVDLRVAANARRSGVAHELLTRIKSVCEAAEVDWATCLIADRNAAVAGLVRGTGALPAFEPVDRWVSVHFIAWRVPRTGRSARVRVRRGTSADRPIVEGMQKDLMRDWRLRESHEAMPEDPAEYHTWIAESATGEPRGALVLRDGARSRRIRVAKYGAGDAVLRAAVGVAARMGVATALPREGDVLRLWSSTWLGATCADPTVVRALLIAALHEAARERIHVVQINLSERDPIHAVLPRLPGSRFHSTLFALRRRTSSAPIGPAEICDVDIARL